MNKPTDRGVHATGEQDDDSTISTWLASGEQPIHPAAGPPVPVIVGPNGDKADPPAERAPALLYGVNVQMGQQGMSVQANPQVATHLIHAFADAMAADTFAGWNGTPS